MKVKDKDRGIQIAQYAFFSILGAGLLYLAFRNQSFDQIGNALAQADWRWPVLILLISILNNISRVLRWKLLLAPLGHHPRTFQTFVSLMFGYFVNLAVPRLGELSRCESLRRLEQVPFRHSLGTVIVERIVDVGCLAIVIILAIAVQANELHHFYLAEIHPHLDQLFQEKTLGIRIVGISTVVIFALGLAVFLLRWKQIRRSIWGRRAWIFFLQIWKGVVSISQMDTKWTFIGHTLFIWVTYYLMTSLWFFCFDATAGLGWEVGLAMMVIGTIARTLPIQGGGVGAYHYLFGQGIAMYGVAALYGNTLAIMIHGLQIAHYLIAGSLAMVYIAVKTKKNSYS